MSLRIAGLNASIDASQVVLPSLFDAFAQPDVLLPLLLANLLSPHLRDLGARAVEDAGTAGATPDDDLPPVLRRLQREIDGHFEHLTPLRTAEVFGEIDLDEEGERLGREVLARAVERIVRAFEWRLAIGQIEPAVVGAVEAMIARRRFPAYYYATFDVVRAHRHADHQRRHAPLGLTSCLDEAAIFAALAMTLPAGVSDTVVVLGSPEHYTAFGWSAAEDPWWFYAKNCLLSARQWRALVDEKHGGDAQAAFDLRFNQFDSIVMAEGAFDFSTGHCSIPDAPLAVVAAALDRFFGVRTRQLDAALAQPVARAPSPFAPLFREVLAADSPATARERLMRESRSGTQVAIERVLLAERSLALDDLSPYLAAARRSPACVKAARDLACVADAIAFVRGVEGRESLFADRERIAMPEETLRLRTGSDRDLALLLQVLLESMPSLRAQRDRIETWFGADDSFVIGPDFCVSLRDRVAVDRTAVAAASARRVLDPGRR
jgi:hypothetical protein